MTRHHQSPDTVRQNEAECNAEAANSDRIAELIGLDDVPCKPIGPKASLVATINRMGRRLYLFRVEHALSCKQCRRLIGAGEYFTSAFGQLEEALRWSYCTGCRRFVWPKDVKR